MIEQQLADKPATEMTQPAVVNKCSAADEMGDSATAKWAEKWGGFCAPFRGRGARSPSNTM